VEGRLALAAIVVAATFAWVSTATAAAATYSVTNTADAGPGSLRQAGTPLVAVDNASGKQPTGLSLATGPSQVLGLEITRFAVGVRLAADANTVAGTLIGTDAAGAPGLGNATGIRVAGGAGNRIDGTGGGARNVVSGNTKLGIEIAGTATTATKVAGNRIGTDPAGTSALPNPVGVRIGAGSTANVIGGSITVASRNLISGNTTYGVEIANDGTTGNVAEGNFIGSDAAGTTALPNGTGVHIVGASGNTVGGTEPGAGNIIAGNFIGTEINGSAALENQTGIWVQGAINTTIGGTTGGAGNVISGNHTGVYLLRNAHNITIAGNYVGTDATATAALGTDSHSVSKNTIGGTANGAGNVISGNAIGVELFAFGGGGGNVVAGDHIGTDPTGTTAIGNGDGVVVSASEGGSEVSETIGGTTARARNAISGNASFGVTIESFRAEAVSSNTVSGNYIGTDKDGSGDASFSTSVSAVPRPGGDRDRDQPGNRRHLRVLDLQHQPVAGPARPSRVIATPQCAARPEPPSRPA
jgi:hypothetical protein